MPKVTPYVSKVFKVENKYKINPQQWRRWTFQQQRMFNELYPRFRDNQELFKHPMGPVLHIKHWDIIAWNTAFTAVNEMSK